MRSHFCVRAANIEESCKRSKEVLVKRFEGLRKIRGTRQTTSEAAFWESWKMIVERQRD